MVLGLMLAVPAIAADCQTSRVLCRVLGPEGGATRTVHLEQEVLPLVDKLLEKGYSESDCKKFLGGNFYRVFQQVWRGSRRTSISTRTGLETGLTAMAQDQPGVITVFIAKKIITMDPTFPAATAVAVRDGRILGVGPLQDLGHWLKDNRSGKATPYQEMKDILMTDPAEKVLALQGLATQVAVER